MLSKYRVDIYKDVKQTKLQQSWVLNFKFVTIFELNASFIYIKSTILDSFLFFSRHSHSSILNYQGIWMIVVLGKSSAFDYKHDSLVY